MKEKEARNLMNIFLKAEKQGKTIYMDAYQIDEVLYWLEDDDDWDDYQKLLNAGLRLHPDYLPLQLRQCFYLIYKERYQEAYNVAFSISDSQNYEVYTAQIDCLFCLHQYEKAFVLMERLVKEDLEDVDLLFADVADFLIQEEMLEPSKKVLKWGMELFPDSPDIKEVFSNFVTMICEIPTALRICKDMVEFYPYAAKGWEMLGKLQVASEEYESALESFDFATVCTNEPESLEVQVLRAYCYYMNNNQKKAIEIFEELQEYPELKERVVPLLAECYLRSNRYKDCYSLLSKYIDQIEMANVELPVLLNFHTCCLMLGKSGEADTVLKLVTELYPLNVMVLHRQIVSFAEQKDFEEAYAVADKMYYAIEEEGIDMVMQSENHEEAKALFLQAVQLYLEKDYESALLCYQKALEIFPEMRIIGFFAAIACLNKKDIEGYLHYTHEVSPEEIEAILDQWLSDKEEEDTAENKKHESVCRLSPSELAKTYLRYKRNHN